jgi:hypothetical protein
MDNPEMIISTECCDKAKKHKAVYLDFPSKAGDYGSPYKDFKPIWSIKGFKTYREGTEYEYTIRGSVEVTFCPFCKKDVPELEINDEAIKIGIHEGDDYCEVCNERSAWGCQCLPPVFRWKPVGSTIILPIREKNDDDDDDDE